MIKSAFKFGLIVLVGAALMGCSDDVKAPADTALDKSNGASSIQRIDFDSRDACIKAGTADMITLKLTDGTSLSLQRGLVDFVHVSQNNISVDKSATNFDEVSQLRFNLPWGYDEEGCAKTVPVLVHETDLAGTGRNYEDLTPFVLKFTPVYAFKNFTAEEIREYFRSDLSESLALDDIVLSVRGDDNNSDTRSPLERTWPNQSQRISEYMASLKVAEGFFDYLSFTSEVSDSSGNHIGFYEYALHSLECNCSSILYFKIGQEFTASVSLNLDQGLQAEFNVMSIAERRSQSIIRNKLKYFQPTPPISNVVKSMKGLVR